MPMVRYLSEKFKSCFLNTTEKELKDIISLRITQNCYTVVLDESKYKDKLNTLLQSKVYEALPKDPTAKVQWKIQNLLSKCKLFFPLIPHHSKAQHINCSPPRSTVGSNGFSSHALAGFLHKIPRPTAGKSESFKKDLGHFIHLLK
jgi:hypothetical protein